MKRMGGWQGIYFVLAPVLHPPPRAGPLSHRAGGRTPARHDREAQRGERVACGEDYRSKIKTAGFGSLSERTTNSDGEPTYRTPGPPMLPLGIPLPAVGAAKME